MSSENLRIMCPNLTCRKVLAVPPTARGKTVRCRACGTNIKIPAQGASKSNAANPPQGQAPAA
ncbi:MAG: hypothetical protein SFY95_07745 [Planctomycetota bacterium]|nr:hypothetical protein [Planctomycetota bacterium]